MANVDFSKYLDVRVEDIKRPEAPPLGHYGATIKSWKPREVDYQQGAGPQPVARVYFTLNHAYDDVEPSELPEGGIAGKMVDNDYDLTDPWMIRVLAEDTLGLNVKGLGLGEVLDALEGQEVKLYMEQRMGKAGSKTEGQAFPKVSKVLAVD